MVRRTSNVQKRHLLAAAAGFGNRTFTLDEANDELKPRLKMTHYELANILRANGYVCVEVQVWRKKVIK